MKVYEHFFLRTSVLVEYIKTIFSRLYKISNYISFNLIRVGNGTDLHINFTILSINEIVYLHVFLVVNR